MNDTSAACARAVHGSATRLLDVTKCGRVATGLIVVHAKALKSAFSNVVPFVLPKSKAPSELREENPCKQQSRSRSEVDRHPPPPQDHPDGLRTPTQRVCGPTTDAFWRSETVQAASDPGALRTTC